MEGASLQSNIIIKKETMIKKNRRDIHEVYTFDKGVSSSKTNLRVSLYLFRNWAAGLMELFTRQCIKQVDRRGQSRSLPKAKLKIWTASRQKSKSCRLL